MKDISRATKSTVIALTILSLLAPGVSAAEPPPGVSLVGVSVPSPFGTSGSHDCGANTANPNWEFEPSLATNPQDRRQLLAAWVQDDYLGVVAAFSSDRGETWAVSPVPGLTTCHEGEFGAAVHVRVTHGLDGTAYVAAALQQSACTDPPPPGCFIGRIAVMTTSDQGRTWNGPVYVATEEGLNHLDNIVADPGDRRSVFVMWAKRATPDMTFVSKVTGSSVTTHLVHINQPGRFGLSNFVALRNDGTTLVNVFQELSLTEPGPIMTTTSRDGGKTWSAPRTLGFSPSLQFPEIALASDNTVYASWHQPSATGRTLTIVRSGDSGKSWTPVATLDLRQGGTLPAPSLVIAPDGSLALIYDDNRNDIAGDEEVSVDVWFARSTNGGASWTETHLASFDHDELPHHDWSGTDGGLGFYQESISLACSVASAVVLGPAAAASGPSDIFFADIRLPSSGPCKP